MFAWSCTDGAKKTEEKGGEASGENAAGIKQDASDLQGGRGGVEQEGGQGVGVLEGAEACVSEEEESMPEQDGLVSHSHFEG